MDAQARFDEIVDDVLARNGDAERTQMMGMPSVKRSGKLCAGFLREEEAMAFKLTGADAREAALALAGAHLFDPSGKGRPFKEWVVVPAAHAARWGDLAETAVTHAA
jgi:4-aminobutyrate aminotransferase-like enzyme